MDLATARKEIQNAFDRMRTAYGAVVFDEWAIVSRGSTHKGVVAYAGPRPDSFRKDLPDDVEPLRKTLSGRELSEGDIEFTPQGEGQKHDAVVKIGASSYLLCNHTKKTIDDLRATDRWLAVQPILFALSEKFRADPLDD